MSGMMGGMGTAASPGVETSGPAAGFDSAADYGGAPASTAAAGGGGGTSFLANSGNLSMATAALSSLGSLFGGIAKSNAEDYNAKVEGVRAQEAEQEAGAEAQQVAQDNARKLAAAQAAYGAAGVQMQGTPLEVMHDLATQGELSRQLTLYQGSVQANADRQQGALDQQQAQMALAGGFQEGSNTLLTGYTKLIGNQTKPTTGVG